MPLYEYICQDCGKRFDSLRSFKEADSEIGCKYCQSVHTKRAFSVFYASSDGRSIAGSNSGGCSCGSCGGGNCSSCSH